MDNHSCCNPAKPALQHTCLRTLQEIEIAVLRALKDKDLFETLLQQAAPDAALPQPSEDCSSNPSSPIANQQAHHKKQSLRFRDPQQKEQKMEQQAAIQTQGCRCSKIDCLKLYCECFARGRVCTSNCVCVGCNNKCGNEEYIYEAKRFANFRNPGFFRGVPAFVPHRKCTCKKSHCQKKYCQCYSAGLKCTSICQCINCCNVNEQMKDESLSEMKIEIEAKA